MRSSFVTSLCLLGVTLLVVCQQNNDKIDKLPGLNFDINFKHYSGYFKVSETHFLHYWFVESQGNPSKDPVIFWFNGGPGCSSLDGLLNEMGPYTTAEDGQTLKQNPYSWNKLANVIYIESPAGVGYSYSSDGNTTTNDDQTALENYNAVKEFFKLYPQFRNNALFVMAESYGGVYGPTLTAKIVEGMDDFPVNLKGMAIGNGYMSEKLNIDTSVRFAYGHGIIDEKIWTTLESECCHGCIESCDLTAVEGHCARIVEDIFQFLWFGGLNPYDLYRDCDPNPDVNSKKMKAIQRGITFLRSIPSYSRVFKTNLFNKKDKPLMGASVPCLNDTELVTYMNDKKTREALHIPKSVQPWDICSDKITTSYQKQYTDMTPFFNTIIKGNVRILLYYGDTDMACNFMMGQQFAASLGLKRRLSKQPWKVDRQIAGFKTIYDGLTFLTIRGAGHMAPQWKAPQMYYAIQQFLMNHPI
uniref:Carboxypeptidase n=1 Tax=Parastrongyloides trichosuri TaxID=131310 RepID=A0A0N4ZEM9_PARTI